MQGHFRQICVKYTVDGTQACCGPVPFGKFGPQSFLRARMGIKVIYGDDSSQYEMVGGTRLSDRKTVARKAATTA